VADTTGTHEHTITTDVTSANTMLGNEHSHKQFASVCFALFVGTFSKVYSQVEVKHPMHAPDTVVAVLNHPARYIIVQCPVAIRATFKLDTYTGVVCQLAVDSNGKESWQYMKRAPTLWLDTTYPNTQNYSLFVSSVGIHYTYLINVNSGATWVFVQDPKTKINSWGPMYDNF
jgi:hypothetical protein